MKQIQSNRIEEKLDIIRDLLERLPDRIAPIQKVIQRPTTNSQEEEFAEQIEERWKPKEGDAYYVALKDDIDAACCYWGQNPEFDNELYEADRIRKTKAEALERSKELAAQREAAETSEPDSGKDGNVTPAGPLRVMPKNNQWVWVVSFEEPNEAIYPVAHQFDRDCVISINLFQAGLCFPDTPSGRLGAELRAKQGILPPQPTQPDAGRFVPESLIKNLRNDFKTAWEESDFGDAYEAVREFLNAINMQKGGSHE